MDVSPNFPEHRLDDPKRQAELAVYRQLQASDVEGTALYETRPYLGCPESDFVIWFPGVGRYNVQVKGSDYRVERGVFYLQLPDRTERRVGSILKQAWDSTMAVHKWLQERLPDGRSPFMVPVVIFPDMAVAEDIEAWAVQSNVRVLWGTDRLTERLVQMAKTCRFYYPPTPEEVEEERAIMLGAAAPVQELPEGEADEARHLHIHADVVNIYLR